MTYIILSAGRGSNLQPLTLKYAKTSYKLDGETTVLQRMVRKIREEDKDAEIVVVVGFKDEEIRKELEGEAVHFVMNPFYETTNSIASLWFAKDYLERENVTIVHGDVVFSDEIIKEYLTKPTDYPYVLGDSSYVRPGAYNIVAKDDQVLVMSKKLENYTAKYCCLTKLDPVSSRLLKEEIDSMINNNMYDQFFEDSLVQMIMFHDFQLFYKDIAGLKWSEVDSVDDLLNAQGIHRG
ncbi:MAG: NTP transferase domain-containing protein [Eubacterium sp.]|nr:NTP transferase domain-containing protein [Eubacterium sp.]